MAVLEDILATLLRIESRLGGTPVPTPTPTPTPQPTPAPTHTPTPAPSGSQTMKMGGTNNFVSGGEGTVVVFPLPHVWPDNTPVTNAVVQFATTPTRNFGVEQYEVCFSAVPGDFEWYKSDAASVKMYGRTFHPGGLISGPDMQVAWTQTAGMIDACFIPPGEQWYMNWRVLNCPPGAICGQTFYVPRG